MTKRGPAQNFLAAISINLNHQTSFSPFLLLFFFFVRQPRLYFITLPVLLEVPSGTIHKLMTFAASVVSQIKHIAKPALFISQSIELNFKGWMVVLRLDIS